MLSVSDPERSASECRIAAILAFVAGAVNGLGFYSSGLFSANMTGNVSSVSDQAALAHPQSLVIYLSIVAAFLVGAVLTAFAVDLGRRREIRYLCFYGIATEAVLLTALAWAAMCKLIPNHGHELIVQLAFVMGLQNALSTSVSNGRIRTTHVSGITTDIGVGLGRLLSNAVCDAPEDELAHLQRLKLHSLTLAAFSAGGIAGVIGFRLCGLSLLFGLSVVLLRLAIPDLMATLPLDAKINEQ